MKSALYKSLALHAAVILLFAVDLPLFWRRDMVLDQVPIMVDLEQVKISEMTNLPAKAKFADEDKPAKAKNVPPVPQPKPEPKPQPEAEKKLTETPKEEPAPAEDAPLPPKQDFVVPPQPSKPKLPDKKPEPKRPTPPQPAKPKTKPQPKKPEPKKADKPKLPQVSALKNLMDSVNALEKNLDESDTTASIKTGTKVANMGIEGGKAGSYFSGMTISETDAIAARLRQCWNLDPGAMGIEEMIVEILAYLNHDGSLRQVEIVDKSRYNNDAHFRTVAESAKRAVYICEPYYAILAQKYGDKYQLWETMRLRFNPINHTVY